MNEPECKKTECKHCECGATGETGHNDCCKSGYTGGKEEFLGLKIYPGQVIKWKGKKPLPNDRCHCGSGKKFKRCCGR